MTHSPLPWRIDHAGDIVDADGYWIKVVIDEHSAANCKLIVLAVNSHDALLVAAKKVLYEEKEVVCEMYCYNELKEAIARAEEIML